MMKAEDALVKALRAESEERGLRVIHPNDYLSDGHAKKADHDLIVMTDLSELGHEDWIVISAYYAMYHSALALLVKIGPESKNHAATAAALEYFFGSQISGELIGKFNETKEIKDRIEARAITLEEKYIDYLWKIKRARETVQYGISMTYKETSDIMKNARDFVNKVRLIVSQLDKGIVRAITKRIDGLKEKAIM